MSKQYVIRSKDKTGNDLFWATDRHAGGYPYWSTFLGSAEKFSLDKIPRVDGYMSEQVNNFFRISEINTVLTDVDSYLIIAVKRDAALAKLTDEDKELLGLK